MPPALEKEKKKLSDKTQWGVFFYFGFKGIRGDAEMFFQHLQVPGDEGASDCIGV